MPSQSNPTTRVSFDKNAQPSAGTSDSAAKLVVDTAKGAASAKNGEARSAASARPALGLSTKDLPKSGTSDDKDIQMRSAYPHDRAPTLPLSQSHARTTSISGKSIPQELLANRGGNKVTSMATTLQPPWLILMVRQPAQVDGDQASDGRSASRILRLARHLRLTAILS